jgi:tetratricopeptide (TPR) repeat protein
VGDCLFGARRLAGSLRHQNRQGREYRTNHQRWTNHGKHGAILHLLRDNDVKMRTSILLSCTLVLLLTPALARAQQYPAPTRTATPSTPAQDLAIAAGIDLHDQEKYDDAIARYQEVLKQNPENVTALFELAFSFSAKKEYQKTLDTAGKGAEYRSDLLPMFYDVIAAALDAMGEPQRAIAAYKRGIELTPDAELLYFNMAVTYQESLKDSDQARLALEKAVSLEPEHAEAHRLLGQLFQMGGYKTQAVLTLARFLILNDPDARGALQGYGLWRAVLRGNVDPALAGVPVMPKNDEGDFRAVDTLIDSSHAAAMKELDNGKPEIETLVGQLDALLTRLVARDPAADRATFVGRHYVPYFVELKQKNFVEPFTYWVSQRAPVPGVREWLDGHRDRVIEFLSWSDKYRWTQ